MKNKEIEELLNMLKKCAREDKATLKLNEIACKTILSYIEQLENNRNKAIEYNEHLIEHAKYHLNLGHLKKMRKILRGGSDE